MLDDVAISSPQRDATLGSVLASARHQIADDCRWIMTVRCDGQSIGMGDLEAFLVRPASQFDRIEFETEHPRAVILAVLRQAVAQLEQARLDRLTITDHLASGRSAEAMSGLAEFVRSCLSINESAIRSVEALGLLAAHERIDMPAIKQQAGRVEGSLRMLHEALTQQDFVLIADHLQYEMDEVLNSWRTVLDAMIRSAESVSFEPKN
jgi:hypothetical protein